MRSNSSRSSRQASAPGSRRSGPFSGRKLVVLGVVFLFAVLASWVGQDRAPSSEVTPQAGAAAERSAAQWPALPTDQYRYAIQGQVVHVADGDTLTVRPAGQAQRRIRLANIDAPETGDGAARPGQPFGAAARRELDRLVAGQQVSLQCYEADQYGRDVCDVLLGGNDSANRRMVAAGYAWANQQGKGKHLRDKYMVTLEQQARREKQGIWAEPDAIRPWVWRYDCWQQGKC
ncbi:TNase-like domain-containing protein [Kerstersia similis]